ncbi:MAG: hypothetical protein QXO67_00745 [Candidatus Bathyarchaeia archaeon]
MRRLVYFWKDLYPLLRQFCHEHNVPLNRVVNLSVQQFLGACDVETVRLYARLDVLMREEVRLRRIQNCMLRSGSYLPSYVQKTLREPGRLVSLVRDGQVPLKALNPREELVFRKIAARREQIASEIAEICEQLLKNVRPFRLKPNSRSRRRLGDKTSLKEVKKRDGETA